MFVDQVGNSLKSWGLKCEIILESRDEFIEVKFYDSRISQNLIKHLS